MLDRHTQRESLALTGDDHDDLARVQDGLYAHGKRHAWHGGNVVSKETRVCEDRVIREGLDTRARRERGPGLVERDVPVLTDAPEEELDATQGPDLFLVLVAFGDEVRRIPVEDVHVLRVDVHCAGYGMWLASLGHPPTNDT